MKMNFAGRLREAKKTRVRVINPKSPYFDRFGDITAVEVVNPETTLVYVEFGGGVSEVIFSPDEIEDYFAMVLKERREKQIKGR